MPLLMLKARNVVLLAPDIAQNEVHNELSSSREKMLESLHIYMFHFNIHFTVLKFVRRTV